MGALTNTIDEKRYGRMLSRALPRIIATARERDRAVGMVEALIEKGEEAMTPEEDALLELLTLLINAYEDTAYPPLAAAPAHETIAFLLEQRGESPKDLWPVLGSKSRVSEILSGKRAVSKDQAKKLAKHFSCGPISSSDYQAGLVDRLTPIEMHFDPILADCAVGLDVRKIRKRRLAHAPAGRLDLFHNLADVSAGRENKISVIIYLTLRDWAAIPALGVTGWRILRFSSWRLCASPRGLPVCTSAKTRIFGYREPRRPPTHWGLISMVIRRHW